MAIQNYDAGQGLSWALRFETRKTEYEISRTWENRRASVELGFWVNENLRLFGTNGQESPWDDPFDPSLEDTFWEAGFAHDAGKNLSAEFAGGERSFGRSWRGRLDYKFQRGSTSLSYNETPTTTGFNAGGGRRGVLDPDDLDEFLDIPGRAERYLSKGLQWNLNVDLRRSGLTLAFFDEDRSDRTESDGTPLESQAQRGIRGNLTWKTGARTEVGVSGSIIRVDSGVDGNRSEFYSVGLNLGYRIGARTQMSFDYSYYEQEPKGANAISRDYVNNVFSLFFTYTM